MGEQPVDTGIVLDPVTKRITGNNMTSEKGRALVRRRWDGLEREIDLQLMQKTGRQTPVAALAEVFSWALDLATRKNRDALAAIKWIFEVAGIKDENPVGEDPKTPIMVLFTSMDSEDQRRVAEAVLGRLSDGLGDTEQGSQTEDERLSETEG